jgi:signal transduction histidine kinase
MPESLSPAGAVLEALGYALFIAEGETLRLVSDPPPWLSAIWPEATAAGTSLPIAGATPFLENFLVDAAECWAAGGDRRASSGPWIECDAQGNELPLEATALTVNGQAVLLIEWLGDDYESRKAVLQKARETVIAYQRLDSEVQKKEILLHCLAEDINGALGNVITSLRLVELEQDPVKVRHLLDLAAQAARQQQTLMHRVLGSFAEELEGLYGRDDENRASADLRAAALRVAENVRPSFEEKGVRLVTLIGTEGDGPLTVTAEAERLERILSNLLENALRVTPVGGEVVLRLAKEEPDAAILRVEDGGAPISDELRDQLSGKFEPLAAPSSPEALRLYYCRVAVSSCEGEIGCEPGETGGNGFWIRLHQYSPAR